MVQKGGRERKRVLSMADWGPSEDTNKEDCITIQGSQRPDGSFRKDVKVRAGYVPPDEAPKFVSIGTKIENEKKSGYVLGMDAPPPPKKKEEKLTPAQKKNLARSKKRQQKREEKKSEEGNKEKKEEEGKKEATSDSGEANTKRVRTLQKKIRQIEALNESKENGAKLNADQLDKISKLEELRKEVETLTL